MKDTISYENEARAFVLCIEDRIKDVLSPESAKYVTPEEKTELEGAFLSLRAAFDVLTKWFVEPLRAQKASLGDSGYHQLWALMHAAFVAGARTILSKSAINYQNHAHTTSARGGKKTADGEKAGLLLEAIIAEARAQRIRLTKGPQCAQILLHKANGRMFARLPDKYTKERRTSRGQTRWPAARTITRSIKTHWKLLEALGLTK